MYDAGREVTGASIFSTTHGLFHTGEVQGIICHFDDHATCEGPSIDLPGGLNQESVQDCCIGRNGFAFHFFHGDEDCFECIGERSYIVNHAGYNDMEFFCAWHY